MIYVLAVNCGSSTIKFRLVRVPAPGAGDRESVLASGTVENIGRPGRAVFFSAANVSVDRPMEVANHADGLERVLDWLGSVDGGYSIDAVGHRIVHGGDLAGPLLINEQVEKAILESAPLAPLHNPPALAAIRATRRRLGRRIPMSASFDTSFHLALPEHARRYALPVELADAHQIRRYGFHGLAHRWMTERAAELLSERVDQTKLITLQLGNGCSMAAVAGGRSIDTSMGATPLEGLIMGTRCGDLDPAVPAMIARKEQLSLDEVDRLLNHRSGLLGLSGRSNDVRQLLDAEADGDDRAALAIDAFCYRARKYVGAYLAALGGADALVFGGGIGENQPIIRKRICDGLQWFGLTIDDGRNEAAVAVEAEISVEATAPAVYVVPVDEMSLIIRDTAGLVA